VPIERHYDMGCIEIDMINTHGLDMTQRLYYFFPKRPIFACFHLTQLEMRMVNMWER
jgi:hypothetical protein